MTNKPVIVLCPMDCEYKTICASLDGAKNGRIASFDYTSGTIDEQKVIAVKCLTGSVNASAAVMGFAMRETPLCVISQGTSGAHNKALKVGDIVLGENIVDNQLYFASPKAEGEGSDPSAWLYPGAEMLTENGKYKRVRILHSDERLLRLAKRVKYDGGEVIGGTICSSDAWNREIDRINSIRASIGSDCEEMESFAAAQVCAMLHIPHIAIRVISNSEHHSEMKFSNESAELCQNFCAELIRLIAKEY